MVSFWITQTQHCLKDGKFSVLRQPGVIYTHTHTHTHFMALFDFVQDYPGKPEPDR